MVLEILRFKILLVLNTFCLDFWRSKASARQDFSSATTLISGNTTLTNQRLDNLSREIADLKESLEFTQEGTGGKLHGKKSAMERNLFTLKKDIKVTQTTKPNRATEIKNKFVDLKQTLQEEQFKK